MPRSLPLIGRGQRRPERVRRALAASVLLVAIAAGLAGCGGSSPATGQSSASTTTTTVSRSPSPSSSTSSGPRRVRRPRGPRAPRGAVPVGHTQRVHAGSSILSVTVTRIYDHLSRTGSSLTPGAHAAAVALTIAVDQGATYDSTASGDVSVITSTGMAAPLFIKQGVCQTPLTDFESLIGVGETRSGCVGFTVPPGARIVAVRFSPHSQGPGSVSWRAGSGG